MTAPATAPQGVFAAFFDRYGRDPVRFVREVWAAEPDADQTALLTAAATGQRLISWRSGHGVGKTTGLSWLNGWHAVTKFPQKTVCTAATAPQLFDALAAETKAWFKKLPPALLDLFEIKVESIHLRAAPEESFISFRTSRAETPEALQGVHSDHVLLICDEASGIPDPIFEAAAGSMSGHSAVTVLAGNPVRTSGLFFDTHHKLRDVWTTLHTSCIGHPRISAAFIEDMKRRYGEESNAFRVRVLGEFPRADDDTVIPFELAESALKRDVTGNPDAAVVWGVDCARFGADASALAKRRGSALLEPVTEWKGLDTMELAGRIKYAWDDCDPRDRPAEINIDVIGLGAGVYDRLRELNLPVRGINVGETAAMSDRYRNLRAELWFRGREWLAAKDCTLAGDDALVAELVGPKYSLTSNGKVLVEGKDEMKRRGLPSPNKADAFLLTLASDHITLAHGSATTNSWRAPVKRGIKGII